MTKHLKTVKASLIMGILLLSAIAIFSAPVSAQRSKLFSFPSYIDVTFDSGPLNEDLAIDKSVNVPLNITYRTDIPENFGRLLPWQLRNIFLFGSMIGPMQKIHIDVVDMPTWADIYVTSADIFVNIPFKGEEAPQQVSLVISPREEAPAVPQSIVLHFTALTIGRITGQEREVQIPFTPSFIPSIEINVENPIREAGPHQSVNYKITVQNLGNKKARVYPDIQNDKPRWTPTINPPHLDVYPGSTGEFYFSVYTPYDFGWHNERGKFDIKFTYKIFPVREDAPVGGPDTISLTITNLGFSTPGFEMITLFAAAIILGIILKKRSMSKP